MRRYTDLIRFVVFTVCLLSLATAASADSLNNSAREEAMSAYRSDTLVVVERIVGIDAQGNAHTLYHEEDGRIYRLDNIDQAVHDLNARGINAKGTFRSLRAVLGETVYVMGKNSLPHPEQRAEAGIPESLSLAVNNLRITKDRVIAIYTTNCENLSI